jgi:protein TonB
MPQHPIDIVRDPKFSRPPTPPVYPTIAKRRGWQGTVIVRALVPPRGQPTQIKIWKSSGKKVLDRAAVAAVQTWAFVPAKRGLTPVYSWVEVPVNFQLH